MHTEGKIKQEGIHLNVAFIGITSKHDLSSLIYQFVTSKNPIGTYNGGAGSNGLVYTFDGKNYMNIVIGSNGYIVNAYHISNKIDKIVFF